MPGLRNIRLLIAYDGSSYGGWQRQKNATSVQGELEAAVSKMHGRTLPVFAAGRTDAGVHARGQVANFYTDIRSIPAERFVPALNKLLPRDIRVMAAAEAAFDFHSRFDARLRRYRYFIVIGRTIDPFVLRFAHQVVKAPDVASLNEAAALLLGERDFSALCSARDPSPSKSREVLEASFSWASGFSPTVAERLSSDREKGSQPTHDLLMFEIAANAFLLRMVRSIVGSLLHWETEGRVVEATVEALATGDRGLAGPTAPARGLFFWDAEYYPEPRRPGRGQWWSRRGYEEPDSGAEGDGEDELGLPDPMPAEPGPPIPREGPKGRLVPGIGILY